MDNESAKVQMIGAIDEQSQGRIATLEAQAKAEEVRLRREFDAKLATFKEQLEQEKRQESNQLERDVAQRLTNETKQMTLALHSRIMSEVMEECYQQLIHRTATPAYLERLEYWIFEGMQVVADAQLYVQLGKLDLSLWDEQMMHKLIRRANDELGMQVELALHPSGVHAGVGPIVSSQDGRRLCDNTFGARFARERARLSRLAASKLF